MVTAMTGVVVSVFAAYYVVHGLYVYVYVPYFSLRERALRK